MLELIFSCFHRFSRVQKPLKSVVIKSSKVNRSKVMAKSKFWVAFGYNFTYITSPKISTNIEFSQAVPRLSYLLELFFSTFWRNLRKILGTDFLQSPKNCQKWLKMAFFRTNERFLRNRAKISKMRPCYFSYIFYPQLRAKFRKNPRSGFCDNP